MRNGPGTPKRPEAVLTHALTHSHTHSFPVLPLMLVITAAIVIVVAEDAERAADVGGDVGVVRLIEADRGRIDRRAVLRLEPARRIDRHRDGGRLRGIGEIERGTERDVDLRSQVADEGERRTLVRAFDA